MLSQMHDHLVKELGDSSRTDTIFVLTAIVFNLIVLAINFGVATEAAAEDDAAHIRHHIGRVHRHDGAA